MAMLKRVAPVVMLTVATSILGAAPADAQPSCQFGGGLGPNSACGSAPEDDFTDLVPYFPPFRRGFGGLGGLYGDNTAPGVSAGPG